MKSDALTQLRSQKLVSKPNPPASTPIAAGEIHDKKSGSRLKRTTATMSLYPADVQRMKEIRRFLEDNGIKRVSDSEAVRIALRQVSLDPAGLVSAYQSMLSDDQRRK